MNALSFNTNYANYNVRRPNRRQDVQPQFAMQNVPQCLNNPGTINSNNTPNSIMSGINNFNFPKINFGNRGNVNSSNNTNQATERDAQFKLSGNPEQDAKNYAKSKGIDLDQAKQELQNMYGEPTQGNQEVNEGVNTYNANNNVQNEISDGSERDAQFKLSGNPEQDAKNYAKSKGIDLDQAKQELQNMYGNPNPMSSRYLFINN